MFLVFFCLKSVLSFSFGRRAFVDCRPETDNFSVLGAVLSVLLRLPPHRLICFFVLFDQLFIFFAIPFLFFGQFFCLFSSLCCFIVVSFLCRCCSSSVFVLSFCGCHQCCAYFATVLALLVACCSSCHLVFLLWKASSNKIA